MGDKETLFLKEDIRSAAVNQHILCRIFLAFIGLFLVAFVAGFFQLNDEHPLFLCVNVLEIGLRIAAMVFVYKLASSLKVPRPWMYVIGLFFPWINLLVLAYLIPRATKVLRANNIRVGVMGYHKEDLNNYMSGNWEKK